MRPIDADALIEFCAERWIPLNIDAVNMQPTIQPEKAQLSKEDTTSGLISRQQTLDALIGAVKKVGILDADDIKAVFDMLPTIQPIATDTNVSDTISRQAVIDAVEKNACNTQRIMDAVNNLPPAQPEPSILLSWVEKYIEWLRSLDNEFANLAAAHISVMVKKWRDEQNEQH